MNEPNVNPVPRPQPEPGKSPSSESSLRAVRAEAHHHRPRITKEDVDTLVRKINYDIDSARAKLTELRAYLAALDLPTADQPFNEERFLKFVRNTAHVYTDESLKDEARIQGAPEEFLPRVLKVAGEVRGESQAVEGYERPPEAA